MPTTRTWPFPPTRLLLPLAVCLALIATLLAPTPSVAAPPCPCTIWPASAVPAVAADPDTDAVEVGVKFRTDVDGFVTGVRFYKGTGNTGTHVGNLWTASGTNLGAVTFTDETATGWQQALFAAPIAVSVRTRLPVSSAARKSLFVSGPVVRSASASS